jgi:tRNA A37 threonylcarbamoyladenosine synthetase subunit TsaC/SUA5/YrdC
VLALLAELNEPLLTSTLILPDESEPLSDAETIRERLEKRVDLVIDAGPCGIEMTTVVNLSGGQPELIRAGKGDLAPFGL